jgi:predicted N-acetyltransferase YhbS
MMIEVRFAREENEVHKATEVAAKSFYPDEQDSEKAKALKIKWANDPFCSSEFILLALSGNEIVGGLRTTPFTIMRLSQEFRCLGIAEIFVSKDFQGLGIASQLVDHLVSSTNDSEYELIVGVARKKIDGFYLKKGFYGIGSYSQVYISGIRESSKFRTFKDSSFNFHPVIINENMNAFYEISYKNVFGRRVRAKADWEKINRENSSIGNLCLGIYQNNELVGYSILRGKLILEIAFNDDLNLVNLIYDLAEHMHVNELEFEITSSHSLLGCDLGFDITVSTRECFYGGHIARIINWESVVQKFFDREYDTLIRSGKKVIEVMIGIQKCQLDLLKKTISIIGGPNSYPTQTVKIDLISYEMTKLLLGTKSEYSKFSVKGVDFSREPFQISPIDEF